jgi:hypothetical protein
MKTIIISIYFMYEWWNACFHNNTPRPKKIDDGALDEIYLTRKAFLFSQFGAFGIGEEKPVMDGRYVNMVLKYGMDLIPYLYGAELHCQEPGGWMPEPFGRDKISGMEPVDLANHPFSQWLLDEWERKIKRYGSAKAFLDFESPTNIAVRLRGEEFYMDLLDDPPFARHILELSCAAIESVFKFQDDHFHRPDNDPVRYHRTPVVIENNYNGFTIGNCNVVMMSEELYSEYIKPYDIRFIKNAEALTGRQWNVQLHHCDVPADRFFDAYKDLPFLTDLQASHKTDIETLFKKMPGVSFQAMVSPQEMALPEKDLDAIFSRVIGLGANELDLWNIDAGISPGKVRAMLDSIQKACHSFDVMPVFDIIPFVWDELEWAYPRYQKNKEDA